MISWVVQLFRQTQRLVQNVVWSSLKWLLGRTLWGDLVLLSPFFKKKLKIILFHVTHWWLIHCSCCRAVKLKQRQNHEKLALNKGFPLSSNCKYYLLPSSWLSTWRSYISTSGKNSSSSVEPARLDDVISSLICPTVSYSFICYRELLVVSMPGRFIFVRHCAC